MLKEATFISLKSSDILYTNPGNRYVAYEGTSEVDGPVHLIKNKEELVEIIPFPIDIVRPLTPIEALLLVGQSKEEGQIGDFPLLASSAFENTTEAALKLFMVEFGRDSLETAKTLVGEYPKIALKTLRSLASSQGLEYNPRSEEEPGKIIHENRNEDDPIARHQTAHHGWEWPYYGTVDATLLFVQLAGSYARRYDRGFMDHTYENRKGEIVSLRKSFKMALEWVEKRVERSPLGFVEYFKENEGSTDNQVWRDSREGYHHADGIFADNKFGIASFSVQVDAYKAYKAATHLFPEKEQEFAAKAEDIRQKILGHFWVEDEGYFALGSERNEKGNNKLLEIKTSDMGHILESGILYGEDKEIQRKKESVVRTLFSDEMLSASGIRTLSKDGTRFNAGAYHNGSIWPRENIKIARGLENHGYYALARELHRRNVNIWKTLGVFPELVRGDDSSVPHLNERIVRVLTHTSTKPYTYNLEQPGQLIQAWSVAAILQSLRQLEKYEAGELPAHSEDESKVEFEKEILDNLTS